MPTETDPLVEAADGSRKARQDASEPEPLFQRIKEMIQLYWHLGFIAFGGPSAHVAILRDHLVRVHDYIEEEVFMELFALGQGLPGPSSTQLVISTAATHGGALGGVIAFIMWSIPGYVVLTISGRILYSFVDPSDPPIWLLGVPPAAMSLIFKASYGFVQKLDKFGTGIGMLACATAIMIAGDERLPTTSSQVVYPILLVSGGTLTFLDYMQPNPIGTYVRRAPGEKAEPTEKDRLLVKKIGLSIFQGFLYFFIWLGLLVTSIVLVNTGNTNIYVNIFEVFYRIGSLIFGGGIVVLPMLQSELVPRGWVTNEQFFQGLGLTQSMPGPMFNFSAFLGAVTAGLPGSLTAFVGLFGPGFILIFAMLPFWSRFRHLAWFKAVLKGLNASAIGLIAAGCVTLYPKSVKTYADAMVFVLAGGLASIYGISAPLTILSGVVFGVLFSHAVLDVGQKHFFETI